MHRQLIDDSINKQDRDSMLDDIFGNDGLVCTDNTICFNEKLTALEVKSKALSSKFYRYHQTKPKTNIKEKVQIPFSIGDLQKMWRHNNSESLNHVLKQAIDWKSQPLKSLKHSLKTWRERLLTLASIDYVIVINNFPWRRQQEERRRLYRRFRLYRAKDNDVVTSTDGQTCAFFLNKLFNLEP